MENIVVVTPMPRARVSTAVTANAGRRNSERSAIRNAFMRMWNLQRLVPADRWVEDGPVCAVP